MNYRRLDASQHSGFLLIYQGSAINTPVVQAAMFCTLISFCKQTCLCLPVQVMKPQEAELVTEISKVLTRASLALLKRQFTLNSELLLFAKLAADGK